MARLMPQTCVPQPRCSALTRLTLLVAAAFLEVLGCSDEATTTDYYYPGDGPGAAGALYRPLRPTTGPGAAGTYGSDALPGINSGGAAGTAGAPGFAGRAGAGGASGLGVAGTSGSELDYGQAGSAGSFTY